MAKKGNRVQVILECTEHKNSGQPGTSRYISTKNKKKNARTSLVFSTGISAAIRPPVDASPRPRMPRRGSP